MGPQNIQLSVRVSGDLQIDLYVSCVWIGCKGNLTKSDVLSVRRTENQGLLLERFVPPIFFLV